MDFGAQQCTWAKRDDVTQNTPPLVAARLLVSKASSFGHKVGPEARCLAVWDCSVAFYHAPLDEGSKEGEMHFPEWIFAEYREEVPEEIFKAQLIYFLEWRTE